MVVLLLSLHSNEMSLQVVQNVAKLNSWEQTASSVTAVPWHGLIWGEIPSYSQEGSPLLLCKGCCISALWILTAWAFCGERDRFSSMLGLSFLTNRIFSSHWNLLQSKSKQPSLLRQPGPAACWGWVREHTLHPTSPRAPASAGKAGGAVAKSQLLPKLSPCVPQPLSVLSPTAPFSDWRVISLNRWIQGNHNMLLENWSPESKTGKKRRKRGKPPPSVSWNWNPTIIVLMLILSSQAISQDI